LGAYWRYIPLSQFFGSPVLGVLSGCFGRKRVLSASLAVTTVSYVFICLGLEWQSLLFLAGSGLVGGLSEANIAITQSAIADVSTPIDRGRLFGHIYTMTSVSHIVGPIVSGAVAARHGYALPFWIVLGLLIITLVWTRVTFQETHRLRPGRGSTTSEPSP
jgi:DHA1 family tetracycline resistance protein-like MFS transporter